MGKACYLFLAVIFLVSGIFSFNAYALTRNADVITFTPPTDGGKYLAEHQSYTLPQLGFNVGGTFDYSYEPLEYADSTGTRRRGIVDDLLTTNIFGAIGITDWWSAGLNLPVALWETFYNPNATAATVQKQNVTALGDLKLETKFRILDIERYNIGVAVMPFMYFPTGRSMRFLGNGMWSPGIKLIVDGDISNRVFMTGNFAYRYLQTTRFDTNNPNAVLGSTLTMGGGINVRINDSWAVLGDIWCESVLSAFFKNQLQNQAEFLVGGRWTPQAKANGLSLTLSGGRGITTGVGSPDFRVMAGVSYSNKYTPPPPKPVDVDAVVTEKIVVMQKIHFEFGVATIRPVSYPILDDVISILNRLPQIKKVRIEGHTDWIGSDAANMRLSDRRAQAVRAYMISKDIDASRLEAKGYGKTKPIADNNTDQGRARNRRTEFVIVQ